MIDLKNTETKCFVMDDNDEKYGLVYALEENKIVFTVVNRTNKYIFSVYRGTPIPIIDVDLLKVRKYIEDYITEKSCINRDVLLKSLFTPKIK